PAAGAAVAERGGDEPELPGPAAGGGDPGGGDAAGLPRPGRDACGPAHRPEGAGLLLDEHPRDQAGPSRGDRPAGHGRGEDFGHAAAHRPDAHAERERPEGRAGRGPAEGGGGGMRGRLALLSTIAAFLAGCATEAPWPDRPWVDAGCDA